MSLSMYYASVIPFRQTLNALSGILDKAEAHVTARKLSPEALLHARLFPDMFHFTRQVQITCDFAVRTAARLSGVEPPKMPDDEKSFAELKQRITKALEYINAQDKAAIDASAERSLTVPMGQEKMTFTGAQYLTRFALPNFYFHATTAYAILRESGVELGKRDFMGALDA